MSRRLRVGDRVCYRGNHTDLGTVVVEYHDQKTVVVAWDTGDIDEFNAYGGRRDGIGPVRATGERWSTAWAAEHLQLALDGTLDCPDTRPERFRGRKSETRWDDGAEAQP